MLSHSKLTHFNYNTSIDHVKVALLFFAIPNKGSNSSAKTIWKQNIFLIYIYHRNVLILWSDSGRSRRCRQFHMGTTMSRNYRLCLYHGQVQRRHLSKTASTRPLQQTSLPRDRQWTRGHTSDLDFDWSTESNNRK